MKVQRATIILASGVILGVGMAFPAAAQVNNEIVINIMRECAKVESPTSRLACYDNNIRASGYEGQRPVSPGQAAPIFEGGPPITAESPQGFGSEDVRSPNRFQAPSGSVDEIGARVTSVRQRQPGIYLVTLDGGAQWAFSQGVSRSFRPPRKGSMVEIKRAALGSFLMVIDGQGGVRVNRIK